MKKNIFVLSLALILTCSFIFHHPVSAADSSVGTYAALCGDCNNGQIVLRDTTNTPWINDHYEKCTHGYQNVNDLIQQRTVIRSYECTNKNCGNGYTNTSIETRRVHPY